MGLGMAAAVLLDAFVIRMLIVPAIMHRIGAANWWLPRWLDRVLPHLTVEGDESLRDAQPQTTSVDPLVGPPHNEPVAVGVSDA
jgi:RND superfamily putative drug exporter